MRSNTRFASKSPSAAAFNAVASTLPSRLADSEVSATIAWVSVEHVVLQAASPSTSASARHWADDGQLGAHAHVGDRADREVRNRAAARRHDLGRGAAERRRVQIVAELERAEVVGLEAARRVERALRVDVRDVAGAFDHDRDLRLLCGRRCRLLRRALTVGRCIAIHGLPGDAGLRVGTATTIPTREQATREQSKTSHR
jgi:hypothetical protein